MSEVSSPPLTERSRSRVIEWLCARPSAFIIDAALVVVRIVLVWIFGYYGAGKLFGWFNGPGIHRTSDFFSVTAHLHPGGLFAVVAGVIEFGGALALAIGLGSRLAGLALVGDQIVAMATVTWQHGINSSSMGSGYEFNLALVALSITIIALGAGRLSFDVYFSRHSSALRAPSQFSVPSSRNCRISRARNGAGSSGKYSS